MNLIEAITHCNEVANEQCNECGKEHQQLAGWLTKLAEFEDKTIITSEWLCDNGFKFNPANNYEVEHYSLNIKGVFISAIYLQSATYLQFYGPNWWEISITLPKDIDTQTLQINSVGQLKMFLSIYKLDNIVEQFKN